MTLITNLDTAHVSESVREGRATGDSIASFLRPANATAYAAGDVISDDASTAKALQFPECAKVVGGGGAVIRAYITVDENMGTVPDLELYLFDEEPTNAADNAAIALADGDLPIAVLRFEDTDAKVVNAASSPAGMVLLKTPVDMEHGYVCKADSQLLYGLLVTRTVFTPVTGTKFTILLKLDKD